MSLQSSASLLIDCRPSHRLALLYAVLFGAAVPGALLPDFPVLFKCALIVLLAVMAAGILRRHILLLSADAVVAMSRSSEQWTVYTRDGTCRTARLTTAACWVFGIMSLVFTAADGKRFHVLLPPDRVQAEPLRELRAWIRHCLPAA